MTDIPESDDAPVDGETNPLTGEVYDATRGEYVGDIVEPAPFTDAQFEEVREFFRGLVARRAEYPMASLLEPDNRALDRVLNSIAYHAQAQALQLQATVRGMMRMDVREHGALSEGGLSPYTAEVIRDFSFKPYIDAAERLRRELRRQRNRGGASIRARQQRQVAASEDMSVDDMLASENAFIVAAGVLRRYRAGRIWWDEFQKNYYTDWLGGNDDRVVETRPLTEDIILNIKAWIIPQHRVLNKLGTQTLTEAVQHVAKRDTRNELTDYLRGLNWDGVERLKHMAKEVFGIEGDEYATRAVMNMMVSAIARAFRPGCQMSSMLVIQSPQDMGKSKLIRVLAGKWYREVVARPSDKDFVMNMAGGWLLEVAELASIAKHGTDDPVVKDAISRATDFIRPPYGRVSQEYPRSSIFIGTTNDSKWHKDVTGGKRFWPITALTICLAWVEANRDQLWAEAVKLFEDGFEYWSVPKEAHEEALNLVAQHNPVEDEVWDRLVAAYRSGALYFGPDVHRNVYPSQGINPEGSTEEERFGNLITVHRVGVWWMGIPIEHIDTRQHTVSRVLTRLGFENVKRRAKGPPRWFWVAKPATVARLREDAPRNGEQGVPGSGGNNSDQWNLIPE